MNYNNQYEKAIRKQLDQGRKAQFFLLVKSNKLKLPIDIQCNLLEKRVFSIMLYGCETCGTQPQDNLEIFTGNVFLIVYLRPSTRSSMI